MNQVELDKERAWLDLIWRAYLLRKARLLPVILIEGRNLWITTECIDPWGEKRRITPEALRAMVEAAEGQLRTERKGVGSELAVEGVRAAVA